MMWIVTALWTIAIVLGGSLFLELSADFARDVLSQLRGGRLPDVEACFIAGGLAVAFTLVVLGMATGAFREHAH